MNMFCKHIPNDLLNKYDASSNASLCKSFQNILKQYNAQTVELVESLVKLTQNMIITMKNFITQQINKLISVNFIFFLFLFYFFFFFVRI